MKRLLLRSIVSSSLALGCFTGGWFANEYKDYGVMPSIESEFDSDTYQSKTGYCVWIESETEKGYQPAGKFFINAIDYGEGQGSGVDQNGKNFRAHLYRSRTQPEQYALSGRR